MAGCSRYQADDPPSMHGCVINRGRNARYCAPRPAQTGGAEFQHRDPMWMAPAMQKQNRDIRRLRKPSACSDFPHPRFDRWSALLSWHRRVAEVGTGGTRPGRQALSWPMACRPSHCSIAAEATWRLGRHRRFQQRMTVRRAARPAIIAPAPASASSPAGPTRRLRQRWQINASGRQKICPIKH